MHWHDNWWGFPMMGMGFFWILVIAGIIAAILWAMRSGNDQSVGSSPPRSESPEEILKRRYANGDIEREEFERRLSDLRR